jgi:hypothetical protein
MCWMAIRRISDSHLYTIVIVWCDAVTVLRYEQAILFLEKRAYEIQQRSYQRK